MSRWPNGWVPFEMTCQVIDTRARARGHTENVLQGFATDTSCKHRGEGWKWARVRALGGLDRLHQPVQLETCAICANEAAEGCDELCNAHGTRHGFGPSSEEGEGTV